MAGEGVALGDDCLACTDLKAGRLVRPFPLALTSGSYYLIFPDDRGTAAKLDPFRQWLLAECKSFAAEIKKYRADASRTAPLEMAAR